MQEEVIFRRRNRLRNHFVNTSNVLLYCYEKLSDAAKITFQVIESFDWESRETHDSKGYVFPAVATIAKLRRASERTIRRHILELIETKLLTRIRRRNKASILYIEEISTEEEQKYFDLIQPKPASEDKDSIGKGVEEFRTDKNVRSENLGERTKMSVAYRMKEDEKKENEINVNANLQIFDTKRRYGMQGMGDILKRLDAVGKLPEQNKTTPSEISTKQSPEERIKRDYFAKQIATELNDEKSLGCYRVIAEKVPQRIIFETLASIKETRKEGRIKKSGGALFVDIIKAYCEKKHIDLAFSNKTRLKNLTQIP